ncbi:MULTISPECIES: acyl carrier protein [Cyclobacterium]|uniref:Acyl carrier protein n=1 Tax=Cyclobacterium plantarum TaxID=2716263 RepID=A0ABX0HDY8_9BACT|nr:MULTISPECIES: acyl carrier protein [Cyclobacterium]MBD3628321.1 acyl carrier protein [Cyclobacterium sp.]NHE59123.1 acyl carrier protein [Cyclobacterium plantarum]
MKNITAMRKAIGVFQSYGIPLTGKKKAANFYNDLRMDKIFVAGLIFELEYELKRELEEEKVAHIQTPSELITTLLKAS